MKDYNEYNVKICSRKIFTLPNILSMIRIAIIPVMVWLFVFRENYLWTAILLAFSAITDVVDGVIARKFNMVTELGKALDPVADKLTQGGVLLCLVFKFKQMILPLIILVVKELFTGITQLLIIKKHKIVVGADWYGKITTVFLYLMIFIHIVWTDIPTAVSFCLIGASLALMISSLIMYGKRNIKIIKYDNDNGREQNQ